MPPLAVGPASSYRLSRILRTTAKALAGLAAFGFTGPTPVDAVIDHAACTLRDLGACGVTTSNLATPVVPGVCAVRTAGYFTAARLRMWAQFSTYLAGSHTIGTGLLIQHSLFITSQRRTQLRADIADLSDTVHTSFCTLLHTRNRTT